MNLFQKSLFIDILIIGSMSASILYDDIQVSIFDSRQRDFERCVSETTAELKDFFESHDISLTTAFSVEALKLAPYIGKFGRLIPSLLHLLKDHSQWRKAFTKAIVFGTLSEVSESEVRWLSSTMRTIQSKIKLLDEENTDDVNRKTIASIIHTELNRMINLFGLKSSLFRKYPLVGAPALIHLASLVAMFSPIVQVLNPLEAMNPQISCKMHDLLVDYRTRTVMARLHKLHVKVPALAHLIEQNNRTTTLIEVMSLPYNKDGYNVTNPPAIKCHRGCNSYGMLPVDACLVDEFGIDIYSGRNIGPHTCLGDYAAFLRHRVEELFPVELLSSLCGDRKSQQPTGMGWFTIHLLNLIKRKSNKNTTKLDSSVKLPSKCNTVIKFFVNGKLVKKTPKRKDKTLHDVDVVYETAKIPRNSTIKLEIWNAGGFLKLTQMIISTEGNIDSFLNERLRKRIHPLDFLDSLETMSFWIDEYK